MPLHHYLPASYIGLFSFEKTIPRRNLKLFAGERRKAKIIHAPAGKLGRVKDFYSLMGKEVDSQLIDNVWSDYESELAKVLDKLIEGSINAVEWARTLVPFIACLMVRGTDFNVRFDRRIMGLGVEVSESNTNYARIFELQRLLGPVCVADWIVSSVQGDGDLITNDLGFAPFRYGPTGEIGLSIPISHTHILQIIPKRSRRIVVAKNGEWFPRIRYLDLSPGNHLGLNESLGNIAQRFIFGPDRDLVKTYLYQSDKAPPIPEPYQLGFISGPLAVVHEFTWHRLIGAISKDSNDEDSNKFDLDFEVLAQGWAPPIYFPTNLPEFPSCLTRRGNIIEASFFEVEGFTN